MAVFGQSGCVPAKAVVIGQSCCIGAKVVVFGQGGCIRVNMVELVQKWLYSGKVVVFRKK